LSKEIRETGRLSKIDVSEVELVAYAIRKEREANLKLTEGSQLDPKTELGRGVPKDPQLALLREAVARLNALFEIEGANENDARNILVWLRIKRWKMQSSSIKHTRIHVTDSWKANS
jgi:hypothetical protein